jgi:hypothetical protein
VKGAFELMDNRVPPSDEGEPLDEGLPEWESVEAERDYWKALALSYGAKISAIRHAFEQDWTVKDGFIEQVDGEPRQLPSIDDVMDGISG